MNNENEASEKYSLTPFLLPRKGSSDAPQLRAVRQFYGMSQSEFARALSDRKSVAHITSRHIQHWEQGQPMADISRSYVAHMVMCRPVFKKFRKKIRLQIQRAREDAGV